jgi:hypothetical protein
MKKKALYGTSKPYLELLKIRTNFSYYNLSLYLNTRILY